MRHEDASWCGGSPRARARRSRPRRARRAARSARRAAPRPRLRAPRTTRGRARRVATGRPTRRCRSRTPLARIVSRSARSNAPASCSAAMIDVVGRAARRDVVRGGCARSARSPGTPRCTRARHASGSSVAQVDAVDLDAALLRVVEPAQQLGERGLARAVHADDRHRGAGRDREVEAVEHGGQVGPVRERHVAEADLARGHAGRGRRASRATGSAPASAITGSSRLSATTGAAAPSSAQLQPPNAIIDVPTIAVRNTMVRSRLMRPSAAALAIDHATSTLAAEHDRRR